MKKRLLSYTKIIIGLTLLGMLVGRISFDELGGVFHEADSASLYCAIGMFFIASIMEIMKLNLLLARGVDFISTAKVVLIGLFMNNFLPSNIGGDAYKTIALKKMLPSWGHAILPVILDRFIGLSILVCGGIVYLVFDTYILQHARLPSVSNTSLWSYILWGCLLASGLIFSSIFLYRYQHTAFKKVIDKVVNITSSLVQALKETPRRWIAAAMFSSFIFHIARSIAISLVLLAFGESLSVFTVFFILAVVAVASLIPISLGALGIREGVMVFMLSFFGVDEAVALVAALIVLSVLWSKSLIGGCLFLRIKVKR